MDARRTITTMMSGMDAATILQELTICSRLGSLGTRPPSVVAARGNLEHAVHETHRPSAGMLLDEGEPHLGISAKMPVAFNTSRSMRVRSSSRRSLAISAAWSDGEATGLAGTEGGEAPGRSCEAVPFKVLRHCLSMDGWIPSSAAICICGRRLVSSSATASRLNSGVNSRLVFEIQHHPRPQ